MPNPLTGNNDAVAQLSGKTLNRLLASMHQNDGNSKGLPTLPHQATVRLGDKGFHHIINGVRGTAQVQVGLPRIELIHGASDRFGIEVWIRAYFEADPATTPFPEYIYGRIRAEYTIWVTEQPRDERIGTRLNFAVDPNTVVFTSETGDTSLDPQITAQVREVLLTRLRTTPHKLLDDFQQQRFRSLVGAGESAVVHALSVSSSGAGGSLNAINQVFLGGRDFAVAVSRELIMSMIQPALDSLKASHPTTTITVKIWKPWPFVSDFPGAWRDFASFTYQIQVATATALWAPGIITINVAGNAVSSSSLAPNASFSVQQQLALTFNAATETLAIGPAGPPIVSANVGGPFGGLAKGYVENTIRNQFNSQIGAALAAAQPQLQAALNQKWKLINQLKTLDDQASVRFDAAEFVADGIVLRGPVSLAPRLLLSVQTAQLPDDSGYTAFRSWIPGGRIERYTWSWTWQTTPGTPPPLPNGSETQIDRFLLRTSVPVPGIPIYSPIGDPPKVLAGQICLTVKGRQLDAVTGDDVTADNLTGPWRERACIYVVPTPPPPADQGPDAPPPWWWTVWLTEQGSVSGASGSSADRVAAHIRADGSSVAPFNTLVHYLDGAAAFESLDALVPAIGESDRDDAGLLVALVLRTGLLDEGRAPLAALEALNNRLSVPLIVTEDVQAGWSRSLHLETGRGGAASRLLDAEGRLVWRFDGSADPKTLAAALRQHLLPSELPRPELLRLAIELGDPAPALAFLTADGWLTLDQLRGLTVSLTFVQPWSRPCLAQLGRLQRLQERLQGLGVITVALVDDPDPASAVELARACGLSFLVGADPHGAIAGRFGVRAWPTTVTLDADGRLIGVEMGADGGALAALTRPGPG